MGNYNIEKIQIERVDGGGELILSVKTINLEMDAMWKGFTSKHSNIGRKYTLFEKGGGFRTKSTASRKYSKPRRVWG
jgi:hypothetical protein